MYNLTIIENILTDLKKIEQALKIEKIDPAIINNFALIIIEIYQKCIMYNKDENLIQADTLSDLYFIVIQYYSFLNDNKSDIVDDITTRMQKIIQ